MLLQSFPITIDRVSTRVTQDRRMYTACSWQRKRRRGMSIDYWIQQTVLVERIHRLHRSTSYNGEKLFYHT